MRETPINEMTFDELADELTRLLLDHYQTSRVLMGITARIDQVKAAQAAAWNEDDHE